MGQPLSYPDILDRYDRAKAFGETRTLPEYAQHLNDIYGTQDYSAGLRDGPWTRASARIDQALNATVGQVTGPIGEAVGSAFGAPEAGYRVGQSLPRALIQSAPLYLAGPEAGIPATIAALGGTGLAFGSQTYADTGSPKAALLSGATAAALPFIGGKFGSLGAKLAGGERGSFMLPSGKTISQYVGSEAAGNVGSVEASRFLGSQLGMFSGNVASQMVQDRALGGNQSLGDILSSPETWLNQIPFTVYDAVSHANATHLTKEQAIKPKPQAPPEPFVPTAGSDEATATTAAMAQKMTEINADATKSPQEKSDALTALLATVNQPEEVQKAKTPPPQMPQVTVDGQPIVNETAPDNSAIERPAAQALGLNPEASLYDRGTPYGDVFANAQPLKAEDVPALAEMGMPVQHIARLVNTLPKANNLVLDMFQGPIQMDATGNVVRLGNTDVSKEGWMNPVRFVKAAQLPKEMLPALQEMYPEAFDAQGRVNATALVKGLQERPMVEVKKLSGEQQASGAEVGALTHQLDTQFPGWRERQNEGQNVGPEEHTLLERLEQTTELADGPNARYSFLGPKSEQNMPGYVEGLMRVPLSEQQSREMGQSSFKEPEGIKYHGPHFGSEDTNVLAFYRGYEETLPDGRKAFHVIEVQSDWGQAQRKREAYERGEPVVAGDLPPKGSGHPLLASYETLALKAAIDHARSIGAEAIILSDAETAMMTEGHDKAAVPPVEKTFKEHDEAESWVNQQKEPKNFNISRNLEGNDYDVRDTTKPAQPSQSEGMRLHYDRTLPDAAAKLTGDAGQRVEVGVHDKARGERVDSDGMGQNIPPGSPVFREPSGQPKSSISGRIYSLENISGGLAADDTLSIKEAVQRYTQVKAKADAAKRAIVQVPTQATEWEQLVEPSHVVETPGATVTQDVEAARLATHTPQLDTALQEQAVVTQEVHRVTSDKEQNVYGESLKDESGRRKSFASSSEAEEYLSNYQVEHPDDKAEYAPRNDGRGGFYLAPVINKRTSLDAQRTEGGGSLHEAIGEATPQMSEEHTAGELADEAQTTRPAVNVASLVKNLDLASQNPRTFAQSAGVELPEAIQILRQAKVILPKVMSGEISKFAEMQKALKDAGIPPFEDEQEMRMNMRLARQGADDFNGMKNFALDSQVPHNEELVGQIGIRQSVTKALQWWAARPDAGVMGTLVTDLLRAMPELDSNVDIQLPGMAGHDPREGWMFERKQGVRANINVKYLPFDEQDAFMWGMKLAHEVAHYATREMMDRTDPAAVEFWTTLEKARQAMIANKAIPKDVKALILRSAQEDHVGKFASGEWAAGEMFDQWKAAVGETKARDYFTTIYGLSNNDELIASLFGDPELVALAQNTWMQKGVLQSALDFFSESWSKLMGRTNVKDTALSHILSSFDEYLTPQRYADGFTAQDYIRESLLRSGVRDNALASRIKTVNDLANKGDLFHSVLGFQREGDAEQLPVTAEYGPIDGKLRNALLLGQPKDVGQAAMGLLVDDLSVAQELWYRMQSDVKLAKQAQAEVKQGLLIGSVKPEAESQLRLSEMKVDILRKALQKQQNALQRMNSLQNFDPQGWIETTGAQLMSKKAAPPEPPDPTGGEAEARDLMGVSPIVAARRAAAAQTTPTVGWLARMFQTTQFLADELPAFKPFYRITGEAQGDARRRATELNYVKLADPATGDLDSGIKDANNRIAQNPGLNKIYSDLRRQANVLDQKGEEVTFDNPVMKSLLARASTAKNRNGSNDRADLITAFNSENNRVAHRNQVMFPEHLTRMNMNNTALAIVGNEIGMPAQNAFDLSKQLYGALAAAKDPAQVQTVGPMLDAVRAQMKPETFLKVLQQAQGLISDSERHLTVLQRFKNYTSEQRYGNFHLVMSKGGEPYRKDFESRSEAQQRAKELQAEGWQLEDIVPRGDANVKGVADGAVVASMRELDQQAAARLQNVIQDLPLEQQQQIMPMIQRATDYESSMAAFSPTPTQASPRRKFRAGREELDMVQNANEENTRLVNWMRHREVRSQTSVQMLDPSVLGNRELSQFAQQHVDSQLAPDNPLVRKINEATYYYHLAGNFGVDFLHSIQTLTTGMAATIAETGGVGDALEYIGKATKSVVKRYAPGGQWETPEQKAFINWLTARGGIGLPTWSDVFDPNAAAMEDASQPKTAFGAVANRVKWGIRGYKELFGKHNDMVLGLAGFQLGLDKGMSFDDAARMGEDLKNKGNYSGGKNSRAVGFYGMKNRAVPQLFGALQNYTFSWFSQLAHNYKVGFGETPPGMSDTQISGAKKAFLYQLGAQAVLAGALGLPGVGQGLALLKQTTGYDLKDKSMQWLADAFNEDINSGGTLTGLAMHGAVAQMGAFDPSGRHIPNFPFLGIKPSNGFDLVNLAPASFATVADLVRGIQAAAKGNAQGAISALPTGVQGPLKLWQGEGDLRSPSGNLLLKMSPAEQFMTALGLTPSRVARAKDVNQAATEASAAATKQRASALDDIASTYRREGAQAGQQKLLAFLQDNPNESPKAVAGMIAQRVTSQTIPQDWRQSVNVASDVTGLPTSAPAQNLDRLNQHNSVLQSLGVQPRNSLKDSYLQAQLDAAMDSQGLTRSQAKASLAPKTRLAPPGYIAPSTQGWQ